MSGDLHRFFRDKRGSTAILSAIALPVLIGFGAFAVDAGNFYAQRRHEQGAGDLAAIAAASDISDARDAALDTLALNGFDQTALANVETGVYVNDPAIPNAQRFTPQTSGSINAVRITLRQTTPMILGTIFSMFGDGNAPGQTGSGSSTTGGANANSLGSSGGVSIRTQSVAASPTFASFAIGSRLLSVNGGVLNAVLGAMLGTNLSLSAMDYQSLISTNIELFSFSNALATRLNMTGVTYDTLVSGNVKVGDVMSAMVGTLNANGQSAGATAALGEIVASAPTSGTVNLSQLLDFGPYGQTVVGLPVPTTASISALDLVSALVQLSNGTHQVQAAVNAGVPGIASASLQLAIGERPQGTALVAVGQQGASVHTAQTRLLLTVQISLGGQTALINLPLYIELASGTAQLASIACTRSDPTTSTVTLNVTPSVIDAWIGAVSNSDFTNFTTAPNPPAATLLNIAGLANVSGLAHVQMSNMAATPVSFSYSDIQNVTKKTTSTTDYVSSLLSNLVGGLQLKVNVVGLGLGLPTGLDTTVAHALSTAASPIDQILTQLLGTLGVGLGQADTWVSGVKCGQAVLVN